MSKYNFVPSDLRALFEKHRCDDIDSLVATLRVVNPNVENFDSLREAIASCDSRLSCNFVRDVLPKIKNWATSRSEPLLLPVLDQRNFTELAIAETDIRYLLANAFFGNIATFKDVAAEESVQSATVLQGRHFGNISFANLMRGPPSHIGLNRLLCLLAFFSVAEDCSEDESVVFRRIAIDSAHLRAAETCQNTLNDRDAPRGGYVELHTDRMEDVHSRSGSGRGALEPLFVDFANRDLHIHKVGPWATQEEILFSCAPSCFVAMMLAERLRDDEVFVIRNVKRYSLYSGYQQTFTFTKINPQKEKRFDVIALDACREKHFTRAMVQRDVLKMIAGCRAAEQGQALSSGHWGCGAFAGDRWQKFTQQLVASLVTKTKIYFSCDGSEEELQQILEACRRSNAAPRHLMQMLYNYDMHADGSFYNYIMKQLNRSF